MITKWGIKFAPCITKIKRVKFEDLLFSAVARMKCYNCGGFKRKKPCPPFNGSVEDSMNRIKKYKKIYMIVAVTDGTVPWRHGIEDFKPKKRVNRELKGIAKGMPLYLHKTLLELKKKYKQSMILISGSCSLCRQCPIDGPCLKGGYAHSPEGSGIDVMNTLRRLGITIMEDIPYNRIVNVGFFMYGRKTVG